MILCVHILGTGAWKLFVILQTFYLKQHCDWRGSLPGAETLKQAGVKSLTQGQSEVKCLTQEHSSARARVLSQNLSSGTHLPGNKPATFVLKTLSLEIFLNFFPTYDRLL